MNPKRIWMYLLVFILAFAGFAFVSFPGEEVGSRLAEMVNRKDPGFRLTIKTVKPALPLGLAFQDMSLFVTDKLSFLLDTARISFRPLSLFRREKQVGIRGQIHGGTLNGSVRIKGLDPLQVSGLELFLEKIGFDKVEYRTFLAELTLSGQISGEYREEGIQEALPEEKSGPGRGEALGRGFLVMDSFLAQVEKSWLNSIEVPTIDFSRLRLDFVRENQRVVITDCTAKGSVIHVKLTGDIRPGASMEETRLNLMGKILPDSLLLAKFANQAAVRSKAKNITRNGIDFTIQGTLKNPRVGI